MLNHIPDSSVIVSGQGLKEEHIEAFRAADNSYAMIYLPVGKTITINTGYMTCKEVTAWWYNPKDANALYCLAVTSGMQADWASLIDRHEYGAYRFSELASKYAKQALAINPTLYDIGLSSGYDTDFHDITTGSNGFSATTGYDLATGWGSPNGASLINALLSTISTPGFGLTASSTAVSIVQNSSGTSTITSTVINSFASGISLSATGQPAGVTVTFSPTSITGAGTSTMTIAAGASAAVGTYRIKITGTSGTITEVVTLTLAVTKAPPEYAISASPTTISVARGGTGTSTITTTISGGFDSAVSLSATGYPIGATVTFTPKAIAKPGAGKSTMKVTVDKKVAFGNYPITINATGAGLPKTIQITLDVHN